MANTVLTSISTRVKAVAAAVKAKLPALKKDFLAFQTWFKSIAMTVATGAALTVHQAMAASTTAVEDLFSPAGLVKLKHNCIYGGLIALVGLFLPSPLKNTLAPTAPVASDTPVQGAQ
jgi:hypothetical protein